MQEIETLSRLAIRTDFDTVIPGSSRHVRFRFSVRTIGAKYVDRPGEQQAINPDRAAETQRPKTIFAMMLRWTSFEPP